MTTCNRTFGQGLGGVSRECRLALGHDGRCTDFPFLRSLKRLFPGVAGKIERDSFQTRGASWGQDQSGEQARRNRQPRWTLQSGDSFFPSHHQTYENCLKVAAELTLQAYEMPGAPACPAEDAAFLPSIPRPGTGVCAICLKAIEFSEFSLARQSKAAVDTDHLDPGLPRRHAPGNVAFVHHICNTSKGDRSVKAFVDWCADVLRNHGHKVTAPRRR